ncbi:hypothetical protein IFT84_17345 [Rhizobium sp. CFBP 8762]|uniref:hypothetical protein n=1 Tax=Rhizobium sp. CFBP 8762 TaxID=2775279 RepID=UPI001782FD56|nr:hypothetical protein [Rhizobium sp. CFBP 8762]MBD8556276.1 hypothetical protein [Rhizobium sp. CFBP 8762]
MIIVRVYRGVADHFPIRVSEWVMVWPALGMWLALQIDINMFTTSPSFTTLAEWGSQGTWALVVAASAICRLAALTINGTFKGFAFSPQIRAAASIVGVVVWSQISLGFFVAYMSSGGALSGAVVWSTLVLLEIANVHRSWSDVGKNARDR